MKETKRCPACGEDKPRTEEFYYFRPGRTPTSPLVPYGRCKPCHRKATQDWRKENIVRARAWRREDMRNLRQQILEHYGKACVCCGIDEPAFLSIDHIHGGGSKHIKTMNTHGNYYRWLVKNNFPAGFQTLCHNCNQAKGYYGCCPHQLNASPEKLQALGMKPRDNFPVAINGKMKTCRVCHQAKPFEQFINFGAPGSKRNVCRECRAQATPSLVAVSLATEAEVKRLFAEIAKPHGAVEKMEKIVTSAVH